MDIQKKMFCARTTQFWGKLNILSAGRPCSRTSAGRPNKLVILRFFFTIWPGVQGGMDLLVTLQNGFCSRRDSNPGSKKSHREVKMSDYGPNNFFDPGFESRREQNNPFVKLGPCHPEHPEYTSNILLISSEDFYRDLLFEQEL